MKARVLSAFLALSVFVSGLFAQALFVPEPLFAEIEQEPDLDWVRLEAKLDRLFAKKSKGSLISEPTIGRTAALPDTFTYEDVPFLGTFIGGAREFRQLQGVREVKFLNTTGTFNIKKGLRMQAPLLKDEDITINLRPHRKRTFFFDYRF
ncbi:MAG TPA: hypothetical protein VGE35_01730 [Candidatus Paceibacterota bacterium]